MAIKKIKTVVKIQIKAAAANPAPPVGTALGPHGLNIGEFCQKFNEATKTMAGDTIPTEVTIYEDRTYSFILKTPPTSEMIKKAIGLAKGSAKPLQQKVGKITQAQVKMIAEKKMPDLNANDITAAMRIVEGTARQMGVTLEG